MLGMEEIQTTGLGLDPSLILYTNIYAKVDKRMFLDDQTNTK